MRASNLAAGVAVLCFIDGGKIVWLESEWPIVADHDGNNFSGSLLVARPHGFLCGFGFPSEHAPGYSLPAAGLIGVRRERVVIALVIGSISES